MNNEKKISKKEAIDLINEFEYFDPETKYIYKHYGNVLQRYSKYLTKWILELNARELNLKPLMRKIELSNSELEDIRETLTEGLEQSRDCGANK